MIHRFGGGDDDPIVPVYQDNRTEEQVDNPLFQVSDKESKDVAVAFKLAKEMMMVSGAWVKLHPKTRNEDIDSVFDEDADPTFWPAKMFKAYFVPKPLEFELGKWGVEAKNSTEIVFFRDDLFAEFGSRLAQIGDIIEVQPMGLSEYTPKYYSVMNAQETGNYRYNWMYVTCQVTSITGDPNIRPHVADNSPINDYSDVIDGQANL